MPDEADVAAAAKLSPPPATTPKKASGGQVVAGSGARAESCPPASPAFTEQIAAAKGEVIYLIGGYARYDRP